MFNIERPRLELLGHFAPAHDKLAFLRGRYPAIVHGPGVDNCAGDFLHSQDHRASAFMRGQS